MAGRQMDVTPSRIAASAQGIDDVGRRLAAGLTTCVDRLNALGCAWGDDDLGQAFFNGGSGSIGFRQARDGLLDAMGHLAFALRGHAVGGVRMARTYAAGEFGDDEAVAWRLDDTPDDYMLPQVGVADSLVRTVPPPPLVVQLLAWLQEMAVMCAWPRGDADGMDELAAAFDALGGVADDVTGVATRHGQAITGANIGEGIQAFATSFAKLTSDGDGHLVDAARGCRDLAEFCRYMGREIRAAQAHVLWGAIFVGALWAVSWLTPAGRIIQEAVGRVVGTFLRRVLLSAEMRAGLAGAMYVGGLNLVGQRVREDFGLQDGIDWASFGESAGLAFATGGAMGAVHRVLGFAGRRGNPVATFLAGTVRGRLVTNTALGAGVNVGLEAASGDGHVNWGKDLFMAGGMALNGEVMGAFKPTPHGGEPATGDGGVVPVRSGDRTHGTVHATGDPAVRSGDPRGPADGVRDVTGDPAPADGVFREASAGDPEPGVAGDGTGPAPVRLAGASAGTEPVAWPGHPDPVARPSGSAAGHETDPIVQPAHPEQQASGSRLADPGGPGPQRGGAPVGRLERPSGARLADPGESGVRREGEPVGRPGRPADPQPHVADPAGHPDTPVPPAWDEAARAGDTLVWARHDAAAGHSPAGETPALDSPVVPPLRHTRDGLLEQIAAMEQHRSAMAGDSDLADAALHHHHPDPEVAALDAAIVRKRQELDALGTTARPPAEVTVTIGGSSETLRVAPGERVILGRRYDPSVTDRYVSRTHAEFGVDADGRPWIRDLGSSNGTVVNHRRLGPGDPAHYLDSGDVVTLGRYTHLDFAVSHPEPGPGEALLLGRRVAEQYGLVMVADSDARDFFHAYTEIIGPGEPRPTGSDGPLTDLAHEVIGRKASFVDLLNLHNRAVELGYEPHRAHDRGELLDILRSASDPPTDDPMAWAGHRLGRAGGMAPLTDREASGLGLIQNHLTRGDAPDAAGYRRLVEVAHAAGFGDWSAHAAGHGARADRDAVLEMVRLVGNHDRFIIDNAHQMAEDLRGIRGFGDPAPGSERFPAHSPASEALAREVLGPDATVADLFDLEREARAMAYRPAAARTHDELVDLLKLADHDLTAGRRDQERLAFEETRQLFQIPERDDDTARIVSAMRGEPDAFAQERLESAARSGHLGAGALDAVRFGRLDPGDASLYDLARRVRPGLEVRDMIELHRYAEETGFRGAHDRQDLLTALRRADAALAPDHLIARRVAENLRIDRADAGALRDLMRAADPAGAHRPTLPRAVAHLNWLANRVRPGLPVSDLLADYRYLSGGARNHPGDRAGLIDALRRADRALHPSSERAQPTSALRTLPEVHVDARFVRDDAGPIERWPLSAGSPPSGPIDFTAASGQAPARLREHLEFFRASEEAPWYWGEVAERGQIRPLEVGWRLDRKALFRGDGRSADIVFTEGLRMPDRSRGYASDPELICTTRSVDTAMEFAIMFGRRDGDRWVYVLDAPGGYDIGGGQDEVKFLGGVDRRHIAGALRIPHDLPMRLDRLYDGRDLYRNRPQDQAEWVPNPYYDPSAR
ncbi:FHA domain-containing protein [Actinoallomurus bryophytorum]|uniref:FHA domain-containing protein n=1 Tax=Actinoallomurus bryophytorum TaxID=1490222 RepID=A0A543CW19_9ACTN|nr:FHA domain-containing protein [Actinoallomurus bryophytorum]TQM01306.1 FHA domain-containing protein [Actinoallomurus bryophytorum]